MGAINLTLQNHLLELDGKPAGRLFAVSGGTAKGSVVESRGSHHQQLGTLQYEDIVLTCGTGMSFSFYNWISSGVSGAPMRKDGAVVLLDYKQTPTARLEFQSALVKAVSLPELNASSNAAAHMKVTLSPEYTRSLNAGTSQSMGVHTSATPRAWNINGFRIKIGALETAHVAWVGPLNIASNNNVLKYSDLVVRVPAVYASGFYKWLEDSVKSRNSAAMEKTGTIEFLSPNFSTSYFYIEFKGLGIYKIEGGKAGLPATITMYCKSMDFKAATAAII